MIATQVLIVGAGPAGSAASYMLSKEGIENLVVERSNPIGSPVICGEFLPEYSELLRVNYVVPGLDELYRLFVPGAEVNRTEAIDLDVEGVRLYRFSYKAHIVNKDALLQKIVERSVDMGGRLIVGARVVDVSERDGGYKVRVVRGAEELFIRAKYLAGADGFMSTVARRLGFKRGYTPMDSALTCNQKMGGVDWSLRKVFMKLSATIAPGGYGWIIPKSREEFNVGLGIRTAIANQYDVHELQEKFVGAVEALRGAVAKTPLYCKTIPVGGMVREIVRGNAALLGDAAGTVVPTNGGGIVTAFSTGILFARAVAEGGLSRYEEDARRLVGSYLEVSLKYRRIADKLLFDAEKLRSRIRLIPTGWMFDVVSGRRNRLLLLLYPLLLRFL